LRRAAYVARTHCFKLLRFPAFERILARLYSDVILFIIIIAAMLEVL